MYGRDYALYKSYMENRYQRTAPYNEKEAFNKFSSCAKLLHGVPQGSDIGPLLFLLYITDLLTIINYKSIPILYVGDTSILVAQNNFIDFSNNARKLFEILNKWFKAILLYLIFIEDILLYLIIYKVNKLFIVDVKHNSSITFTFISD
jgi:hypothetical protein